jgi:hypothetical protein
MAVTWLLVTQNSFARGFDFFQFYAAKEKEGSTGMAASAATPKGH